MARSIVAKGVTQQQVIAVSRYDRPYVNNATIVFRRTENISAPYETSATRNTLEALTSLTGMTDMQLAEIALVLYNDSSIVPEDMIRTAVDALREMLGYVKQIDNQKHY